MCTELIGWRDLSRKLLLYITDAGFHYANDGKVGSSTICRGMSQLNLHNYGERLGVIFYFLNFSGSYLLIFRLDALAFRRVRIYI